MRGARSLDGEAPGGGVTSVVRVGQSEIVEHASHVEQLFVMVDVVALGEQRGERPGPQAVAVERGGRELPDAFLGFAGERRVGRDRKRQRRTVRQDMATPRRRQPGDPGELP